MQAPLFHRSTRKVVLSEVGLNFYEECSELLTRFDSITDRMRVTQDTPMGVLRLQILPGFALGHFGRALKSFSDEIYRKLNSGTLGPVLATLKTLKRQGVWTEVINLVVPTYQPGHHGKR